MKDTITKIPNKKLNFSKIIFWMEWDIFRRKGNKTIPISEKNISKNNDKDKARDIYAKV